MIDLTGKRALVTGSGRRLGQAIALALGVAKMRVAVHYHQSSAGAEQTASAIRDAGGEAFTLSADLSHAPAARDLVNRAIATLSGLDLLVVSAGNFERVPFRDLDDAAWRRAIDLNLAAGFALSHQAHHALADARGSIVFITCSSATTPFRNYLPYVVSKGGLRHLMQVLALELAPLVRVNAVAPGTVLPAFDMDPAAVERLARHLPLRKIGSPEDIAQAVLFLAKSEFITGHEIVVDGGRSVARLESY